MSLDYTLTENKLKVQWEGDERVASLMHVSANQIDDPEQLAEQLADKYDLEERANTPISDNY